MSGLERKVAAVALIVSGGILVPLGPARSAAQVPANDAFADAAVVTPEGGTFAGTLVGATNDGANTVGNPNQPDVWYDFTPGVAGVLRVNTCGTMSLSGLDTTLSVHSYDGTVGTTANQLQANDDFVSGSDPNAPGCSQDFQLDSALAVPLAGGERVLIRVSQFQPPARDFVFHALFEADFVDADGDGVADDADNCAMVPNPDQFDGDGDGYGSVCDADLNQDCIVNPLDLGIFRTVFFTADAAADFNGDGVVNPLDLGIFRTLFFTVPGPSGLTQACGGR